MKNRYRSLFACLVLSGLCSTMAVAPSAVAAGAIPSVFCEFTEPHRWVVLSPDGVLVEAHEDEEPSLFDRYTATSVKGSINTRLTVTLPASAGDSKLVITKGGGESSSHIVTYRNQTGTCDQVPTGFLLRTVAGVEETDKLNIRTKPNSSAEIITSLGEGTLIWVKPTKSRWIQAAVAQSGEGAGAPDEMRTGWVNSKFVTKSVPRLAHALAN
jgi:uncharacterized protein YgiM (DUF1202 family)